MTNSETVARGNRCPPLTSVKSLNRTVSASSGCTARGATGDSRVASLNVNSAPPRIRLIVRQRGVLEIVVRSLTSSSNGSFPQAVGKTARAAGPRCEFLPEQSRRQFCHVDQRSSRRAWQPSVAGFWPMPESSRTDRSCKKSLLRAGGKPSLKPGLARVRRQLGQPR